jgi:hypothetical protein
VGTPADGTIGAWYVLTTRTDRDWLGDFRPGSLLILDEAHHAAPASGSRYAIDSRITRAIPDLAPCFEHRLFLSTTPYSGHSNSFSALLEILDPQRFCRGVPVKGKKLLEDVMVRRLKEDIRAIQCGFPILTQRRRSHCIAVLSSCRTRRCVMHLHQ